AAGRPRCCGGESWNYPWRAALGNRKLPVVQNGPERPAVLHLGHYGICWGLGCGQGHEVAYGERCFGPAVYCKFRKYFLPRDVRSYRQSDEKTPSERSSQTLDDRHRMATGLVFCLVRKKKVGFA